MRMRNCHFAYLGAILVSSTRQTLHTAFFRFTPSQRSSITSSIPQHHPASFHSFPIQHRHPSRLTPEPRPTNPNRHTNNTPLNKTERNDTNRRVGLYKGLRGGQHLMNLGVRREGTGSTIRPPCQEISDRVPLSRRLSMLVVPHVKNVHTWLLCV